MSKRGRLRAYTVSGSLTALAAIVIAVLLFMGGTVKAAVQLGAAPSNGVAEGKPSQKSSGDVSSQDFDSAFKTNAAQRADGHVVPAGQSNGITEAPPTTTKVTDSLPNIGCVAGVPGPWSTVTPATTPPTRYRAGGTSDTAGNVYIYGGGTSTGTVLNDLWRFNTTTNTWTQLPNMPTGKQNIQGSYYNGKIYVPGGYSGTAHITELSIYDIASDTWTTGAPEPAARSGMTAAYNGKIYVFGGNPGSTNEVLVYNIASNTWTTDAAVLPAATTYGRAITAGNYIYVIGGISSSTTVNTNYRFDPAADSFTTMAPLQTARASAELMTDGTSIFAVNGGDETFFRGVPQAQTVEIYNIATNSWSYGNPVVNKAAASAGGLGGGELVIQGGEDNPTYYSVTQISTLSGPCPTATATSTATSTAQPSATATVSPTACPIQFADVPASGSGSTFYVYARCLVCRGIVSGYACGGAGEPCNANNDPYYRPGANVTRGQLSKIISNAAGLQNAIPAVQRTYSDVPTTDPFWLYIERLSGTGAISGYACNTNNPQTGAALPCDSANRPYFLTTNNATRGQISKIVSIAAGFNEAVSGQTFSDVPPTSPFYQYIERLSARHIIDGYNDAAHCGAATPCFLYNTFTTRGQMAKIAANAFFPNCQTAAPEAVIR